MQHNDKSQNTVRNSAVPSAQASRLLGPGIAFLGCGVTFLATGIATRLVALWALAPAFIALGVVFIALDRMRWKAPRKD